MRTAQQHAEFLKAHKWILRALTAEMMKRPKCEGLDWIDNERMAVTLAANEWAVAKGGLNAITTADVERIEPRAVGHIDYATKLCLYVTELLYDGEAHSSLRRTGVPVSPTDQPGDDE